MKDWIKDIYVTVGNILTARLRVIVQEAWDAITPDILEGLIDDMHAGCQAVINAQGKEIE